MVAEVGNGKLFTLRCKSYETRNELVQNFSDNGFQLVSETQGMVAVGHGINIVSMPMIHLTFIKVDPVKTLRAGSRTSLQIVGEKEQGETLFNQSQ